MNQRQVPVRWMLCFVTAGLLCGLAAAAPPATQPTKVYVPYEKLKGVFESTKQGVFLPYAEFERLWRGAQGTPAAAAGLPAPYLLSTARFIGKVDSQIASVRLELVVDILGEGWVEVPIGLGDVAVADVSFAEAGLKPAPLLRVAGGQYVLLTKGTGRRTLRVDFVRQLDTQPGLNVLSFRIPPAAITTLELAIPEENLKVDVEPMLAAATEQVDQAGAKATRLRAFLGSANQVKLSWKPKTQAAAELAPVVISEQLQHIDVGEALVSHEVQFTYDIRRRGVDSFTVQLPRSFRVTSVEGDNIAKWDIAAAGEGPSQNLLVNLFSLAKGTYKLTVKMERFLKESQVKIPLVPVVTQQVLRRTGLVAITHSPRRGVELVDVKDLARVDTGRLPAELRGRSGATAWRFITPDYAGTLDISTVSPRITAHHLWALGVDSDRLELRGRLTYTIERTGVFQLSLNLPEPWEIVSFGPDKLVDDYQLAGKGRDRAVNILLKREMAGTIVLELSARAPRPAADAPVALDLPLADAKDLRLYSGQLLLLLADRLRAEVDALAQLQPLPLNQASGWTSMAGLPPAMAFEFRAIDRAKDASAKFNIAVKPTQVSAAVHRLVKIEPGSVQEEALIDYRVLYAPVDTFYLTMPAALADQGVEITGRDIKEQPRIKVEDMPADQRPAPAAGAGPATRPAGEWAYYKIVLQSPVIGSYRLRVGLRRKFQAGPVGTAAEVRVEPILAAGRLSDQVGYIAVAKADTLAIGKEKMKGLTPADPTSATDVPEASHRAAAALAFRYNAPPFELVLPVVTQQEAVVFTTIASGAIVEQVLARDGTLNTHATFLLATSKGDRLPITLPKGAKLFSVLLNGAEAPVEAAASGDQRIVRLPPSAGQVTKIVLEVSYAQESASARSLGAVSLPAGIPVQQTLWRLYVPDEDRLLWFSTVFSRLEPWQGNQLLQSLAEDQPAKVAFKLAPQGRAWTFVRQGAPGTLSTLLLGRETFSIVIWLVILAGGIAALRLSWFHRSLVVLAAAVAVLIVRLLAPLLAGEIVRAGLWAVAIVLGLWVAHWLFRMLPGYGRRRKPRPPAPVTATAAPPVPPPPPIPQQGDQPGDQGGKE